jgi:PPM family protein phosphatase
MTLELRYSARSDRGLVRHSNQDAVYAGPRLLALADGMGGHAAGEVASSLVISALAPLDEDEPGDDLLAELREATVEGNSAITRHVADSPDLEGMGTTLTAILFAGTRMGLVHIGDSRAYQLRQGVLSQITKDDTFVQSLIDEGRITEDEAQHHPQRSLLLRAITGQDVEPSLTVREARAGDRYLLCSDGLSGVVSDETLAETLSTYRDPRECADRLIELALRGGGPDNITCIVADVVDVDFGEDAPIVGGSAGRGEDLSPPDSAAARASATTLPRARPRRHEAAPAPVAADRRHNRLRLAVSVLAVLAVLVAGGVLTQMWVQRQYFVAVDEAEEVTIYRGLAGSVLGFSLNWVERPTGIALADLQPAARGRLAEPIPVEQGGLPAALQIVASLRADLLPECPPPGRQQITTAVPRPPTPVPGSPDGDRVQQDGALPTAPPDAPEPLPEPTPEPGTDCRPV